VFCRQQSIEVRIMKGIVLAALFVLATCAGCGTTYHVAEKGSLTGYRDTSLAADWLIVSFTGTAATGRDAIHQFGLLRAAEIASVRGYPKLQVLNDTIAVIKRGYKGQNRLYRCVKEVRLLSQDAHEGGVVDVAEVIARGPDPSR
jgi:hypothetical protein